MQATYTSFLLQFRHPFGVSSNIRRETPSVFLRLSSGGYTGYGEACLPAYLGETPEATRAFLEKTKPLLENLPERFDLMQVLEAVDRIGEGNNAAKAAVDIALHDLFGKMQNKSVAALYGYPRSGPVPTSFTIGIDKDEEVLARKIAEAADFPVLKIKAGTEDDRALIELVRKYTAKPLYVDVNQGWSDKYYVLEMIMWMKTQNVVLVEQPMPVAMQQDMAWVTARSPLPTIADESVKRLKDLELLNGEFTGVNIKLMKCTGIAEAVKMIAYCRSHKLSVLLGCMAESSCGSSAMAQLMGLADHIDLDAPLLYKNDPFRGIVYREGKVYVADQPGTSVQLLPGYTLF